MAQAYIALWEQLAQNLTQLLYLPVAAPPQHPDLLAADHLLEYLCHAAAPDAVTAKVLVIDKQVSKLLYNTSSSCRIIAKQCWMVVLIDSANMLSPWSLG